MNDPLLVLVVLAGVGYILYRLLGHSEDDNSSKTPHQPLSPEDRKRREDAKEELQNRLTKIKNRLNNVEDEVDHDPQRAARTLRTMMKKK